MKSKFLVIRCLAVLSVLVLWAAAAPSQPSNTGEVEVPAVSGLSPKAAKSALETAGLAVKWRLGRDAAAPGQAHRVYQVDPPAGTRVKRGTTVFATIYAPGPDMPVIAGRGDDPPPGGRRETPPGIDPPPGAGPVRSKLASTLSRIRQTRGEGAERFFKALPETLDIDIEPPDPVVGVFIQVKEGGMAALLANGFTVETRVGDIVTAAVPVSRLDTLAGLPDVVRVEASRKRRLVLDRSIPDIRADRVHGRNGDGTFSGFTGRGVVVGVIDTGIDWKHPDFQRPPGSTRIKFLWDLFDNTFQTSGGRIGTAPPANQNGTPGRGTVYTEDQINAALGDLKRGSPPQVFSRDQNGHGTHVAGIAAGVAPEAELVIVQAHAGGFSDRDVIGGLRFINDRAVSMSKPWVANLSLGGHYGPHDGTTSYERGVVELVGSNRPGKAVVVAAGNEGGDRIHTGPWGFVYDPPVLSPGTRNDPVTGAPFVNFGLPGAPCLNGSAPDPGAVVFRANFVAPTAAPNFDGIFITRGNRIVPVVRNGDPAPLVAGGRFGRSFQRPPSINTQGDIAFDARYNDPATPRLWKWGIFVARGALGPGAGINIQRIAAHGQTAPGFTRASNRTLSFGFDPRGARGGAPAINVNRAFSLSRINDRREVAFTAQVQDPDGGLTLALFMASPAGRSRLAMAGDPAAGTGGGTFAAFLRPVGLNNRGKVAFTASIRRGTARQGIFTVEAGNRPVPVVLAGAAAPETQGGTFSRFGHPSINDNGAVVFSATVAGAGAPGVNAGIFLAQPGGEIVPVVLSGQPTNIYLRNPPSTFAAFPGVPAINNDGFIAFRAQVANGTVRQGIFLFMPDSSEPRIVPVAMSGKAVAGSGAGNLVISPPAPGTTAGEEFDQFGSPVMNPASPYGALTFGASLQVPVGWAAGGAAPAGDGIFVASLASGRLAPNRSLVIQLFRWPTPAPTLARFDFWLNKRDRFTMTAYGGPVPGIAAPAAPFPLHLPTGPPFFVDNSNGLVVTPNRGNEDIEVDFRTARRGHFIVTLTPTAVDSEWGRLDGWIYASGGREGFIGLSDDRTHLVGQPGTAADAITVGAHMSKNRYTDSAGNEQESETDIGALATFSSPGTTRDARRKPELTAPGMFIASARADIPSPAPPALPPWVNRPEFILPGGKHVITQGTSQAAPHVTGAIALMLEKNAGLASPEIKKILMSTARTDAFTDRVPDHALGTIPDPEERISDIFWGAGKLNILSALDATPVGAFIAGRKYEDLNGNGVLDPGEPGLQGWIIFRDVNNDGVLNNPVSGAGKCDAHSAEPCRETLQDGSYRFKIIEPGAYRVREVPRAAWKKTSADPPDFSMDRSASSVTDADFGNFKLGIIAGKKFNDLNGNGVEDPGEPGLPEWPVFIDSNEDGILNSRADDGVCDAAAAEFCTLTDDQGRYAFVLFRGAYPVREVGRPGWRQTTPNPDFVVINRSGQAFSGEVVPGLDFGKVQTGN